MKKLFVYREVKDGQFKSISQEKFDKVKGGYVGKQLCNDSKLFWNLLRDRLKKNNKKVGTLTIKMQGVDTKLIFGYDLGDYIADLNNKSKPKKEKNKKQNVVEKIEVVKDIKDESLNKDIDKWIHDNAKDFGGVKKAKEYAVDVIDKYNKDNNYINSAYDNMNKYVQEHSNESLSIDVRNLSLDKLNFLELIKDYNDKQNPKENSEYNVFNEITELSKGEGDYLDDDNWNYEYFFDDEDDWIEARHILSDADVDFDFGDNGEENNGSFYGQYYILTNIPSNIPSYTSNKEESEVDKFSDWLCSSEGKKIKGVFEKEGKYYLTIDSDSNYNSYVAVVDNIDGHTIIEEDKIITCKEAINKANEYVKKYCPNYFKKFNSNEEIFNQIVKDLEDKQDEMESKVDYLARAKAIDISYKKINCIRIDWVTQEDESNDYEEDVEEIIKKTIKTIKNSYDYKNSINIELHYLIRDKWDDIDNKNYIYKFEVK